MLQTIVRHAVFTQSYGPYRVYKTAGGDLVMHDGKIITNDQVRRLWGQRIEREK